MQTERKIGAIRVNSRSPRPFAAKLWLRAWLAAWPQW
jgi:hypothetical protein